MIIKYKNKSEIRKRSTWPTDLSYPTTASLANKNCGFESSSAMIVVFLLKDVCSFG